MISSNPYTVEPFQPVDAEKVSSLFSEVYGDAYPIKTVYDPEQLVAAFETRRYFPFLVRTPSNMIIGYGALYNSAPYKGIFEFGQGVVSPDFRSAGIGRLMFEYVAEYAPALPGSEMYFGEAVCNHTHTQKAGALIQTIETGIEVDLMPGEVYDKFKKTSGRVAALDMFRTFVPKPHTVYVPEVYENIFRYIYGGFDDTRKLVVSAGESPSAQATQISAQIFDFAGVARIAVTMAGDDFEQAFDTEEHVIINRQIGVIQVWLKLSCPWIRESVEVLRRRGYFFGGLFPRWFDEDGLLVQKIIGQPNWEEIHLYSARSEKILSFIYDDWRNTHK